MCPETYEGISIIYFFFSFTVLPQSLTQSQEMRNIKRRFILLFSRQRARKGDPWALERRRKSQRWELKKGVT